MHRYLAPFWLNYSNKFHIKMVHEKIKIKKKVRGNPAVAFDSVVGCFRARAGGAREQAACVPLPAASPGPALGSVSGLKPTQRSPLTAASTMVA